MQHFWQRWSNEYVVSLRWYNKWRHPTRNVRVGDIVMVQDKALVPYEWPLGKLKSTSVRMIWSEL